MLGVGRAIGTLCLGVLVEGEDLLDVQEGEEVAVDVPEREGLALGHPLRGINRQGDRQGPEGAVGQPHLGDNSLVVGLAHEPLKRRETARGEQFKVAEPSLIERQAREFLRGRAHFSGPGIIDNQIDQRPAVGRIGSLVW